MLYNQIIAGVGCTAAGDGMSELQHAQQLLEGAEQAATAGDLASADQLLRRAARIQEAELGPGHPDLAHTLNNLAIVAERRGPVRDAEMFYRQAAAMASAARPADDQTATVSRQSLEESCHARGLPMDGVAVLTPSARDTALGLEAFGSEDTADARKTAPAERAAGSGPVAERTPPKRAAPPSAPRSPTLTAHQPPALARRRASRLLAWAAIGVGILVIATLFARQPWSSRDVSRAAPATEATAPQATEPAPPSPAAQAPVEPAQPPRLRPLSGASARAVPQEDRRDVVSDAQPAPTASSGDITLATAELCRTLSRGAGRWRCDPAGDAVAPGPILFYTRVRSPRDTAVVHRWYRGETLQSSVKLTIRANRAAGYRTYSRQTLNGEGDWRVEVSSADGDLLHEQRFVVR